MRSKSHRDTVFLLPLRTMMTKLELCSGDFDDLISPFLFHLLFGEVRISPQAIFTDVHCKIYSGENSKNWEIHIYSPLLLGSI